MAEYIYGLKLSSGSADGLGEGELRFRRRMHCSGLGCIARL